MTTGRSLFHHWSGMILTNRYLLWALFLANLLGTIYGYDWYAEQIAYTWREMPAWLVPFVPDSPTASLFFTVSVLYLLYDCTKRPPRPDHGAASAFRAAVEALAAVTSVKYGIWAVVMIVLGALQGDPLYWEHWMLIASHLAMAAEALLFLSFYTFRARHLAVASAWMLSNDYVDYHFQVFPWLPDVLNDDLNAIRIFTFALSVVTIGLVYGLRKRPAGRRAGG